MHRAVLLQGQGGKVVTLNFEQGQVGFFVQAHELGVQNLRFAHGSDLQGRYGRRSWQHHANPLCAFHHVSIGHDVAIRIDDDSRTNGPLAHDQGDTGFVVRFHRRQTGGLDLDHGGRHFGHQSFERAIELTEHLRARCRAAGLSGRCIGLCPHLRR